MKKTVLFLLIIFMTLTSLASCSSCGKGLQDGKDSEEDAAVEAACVALSESLLKSSFSLDYRTHCTLFPEASLKASLYEKFRDCGFEDVDAALKKIEATVPDLRGFERVSVQYSVKKREISDAQRAKGFWDEVLSKTDAGKVLDREKIEGHVKLDLVNVRVSFEELFVLEQKAIDLELIKYDGQWYLNPAYIDDERSIDLLESNQEDADGFYEEKHTKGAVTAITDQYLVLDDEQYYWIGDCTLSGIAVGDTVTLDYLSMEMEASRISDGKVCGIRVLRACQPSQS